MEEQFESYLSNLKALLQREVTAYQDLFNQIKDVKSLREKVRKGYAIYPLIVKNVEYNKLGKLVLKVEKVPYWPHSLSNGTPARIYSVNDEAYIDVSIGKTLYDRVEIILSKEEEPDWIKSGKLALLLRPDERSFKEMERAINELGEKSNGFLRQMFRSAYGLEKSVIEKEEYTNEKLNESQIDAVRRILGDNPITVVHGPPGTGKTTTLTHAVFELLKQNKRILVATPSNASADYFTQKMLEYTQKVVRVGNISKIDDELEKHTLELMAQSSTEAKLIKEYQREINKSLKRADSYIRNFGAEQRRERNSLRSEVKLYRRQIKELEIFAYERILADNKIAVGTLIGLCRDEIKKQNWDVVIIDEAAQSFESACWAVASFGKRLVLAGDHCQLPPTLMQEFPLDKPYQSLQEKVVQYHPESVVFLDTQYRMEASIKGFSNNYFYQGRLKSALAEKENPEAITFIDTAGCGMEEGMSDGSRYNEGEISILTQYLENENTDNIGVISPYSQQVKRLRDTFKEVYSEKDIQSIDGFQGQERDVIILSLVRSNTDGNIGFLKDYRRMNVALTRAKSKLIVIGDSATIGMDDFYQQFLEYVEKNGTYRTAWEWMG